MSDRPQRRIVSLWFPRLASDRALRRNPVAGPFVLTRHLANTQRIHCLNAAAAAQGLYHGMPFSEARAFCPGLRVQPADPAGDALLLQGLRRWALRYCPWAGLEDPDGLVLDITGAAHLSGGESALLADLRARLTGAGFQVRLGLADTRGAAWALAHHGEGIAAPGDAAGALRDLPVAALRLEEATVTILQRLGLRSIGALAAAPRAPLARRFGPDLLMRLDQAMGAQPEAITPLSDPPRPAVRLTLPEPIGLISDVMAGLARLLAALCARLAAQGLGARVLVLGLRRVDRGSGQVPLRLARAMRDPDRILPLFAHGVDAVDAGFGIDQLRLEAVVVEPMPMEQLGSAPRADESLDLLISRLGTRVGLENVQRFRPADSHLPERSFVTLPVADAGAVAPWRITGPRPQQIFPPESIPASGAAPPARFRWRRMTLSTARVTGPERIAPEWWHRDAGWETGLRDYWRVATHQGPRLWLFHTPQVPGWFVQGEFL